MFEQKTGDIRNVVLVHGGFVDGSRWEGVYRLLRRQGYNIAITQHPDHLAGRRRPRRAAGAGGAGRPGRAGGTLVRRRGHHRGGHRPQRGRRWSTSPPSRPTPASPWTRSSPIRPQAPRCRRSFHPPDGFLLLDREKFAASFAAGPRPRVGGVHGGRAAPLGSRGPAGRHHSAGVADQAELVPRRPGRPDDPASRPARDGRARRRHRRRVGRQPSGLRVASRGRGRAHRRGGPGSAAGHRLTHLS